MSEAPRDGTWVQAKKVPHHFHGCPYVFVRWTADQVWGGGDDGGWLDDRGHIWQEHYLEGFFPLPDSEPSGSTPFQERVALWMQKCFGPEISADVTERNHRFLEEALELVQSRDCTADEAHQLVGYVYGRAEGDTHQEIGGVMITLAALCLAIGADMHEAGDTELVRIWGKIDVIRAKQAAKPKHSPLPESS